MLAVVTYLTEVRQDLYTFFCALAGSAVECYDLWSRGEQQAADPHAIRALRLSVSGFQVSPVEHRGTVVCANDLMISVGVLLAYCLGWLYEDWHGEGTCAQP